jgi:hypothetical protein
MAVFGALRLPAGRRTSPAATAEPEARREPRAPLSRPTKIALVVLTALTAFLVGTEIVSRLNQPSDEESTAEDDTAESLLVESTDGLGGRGRGRAAHPLALIDEGRGWRGKLSLCDPASAIVPAFGQPTIVDAVENVWYGHVDDYTYKDGTGPNAEAYLAVRVNKSINRVVWIQVASRWRTARGLSQDDTTLDMKRVYGEPNEEWGFGGTRYEYPSLGMTFYPSGETRRVVDDEGLPRDVETVGTAEVTLFPRSRSARCPLRDQEGAGAVGGPSGEVGDSLDPQDPEGTSPITGAAIVPQVPSSSGDEVVAQAPPGDGIRQIEIARVAASSEIGRHPASHAADGDLRTAWNEASRGDGTGEWIELQLVKRTRISRVEVFPGFLGVSRRGFDLFAANNRPAHLTVSVGDDRRFEADLADSAETVVIETSDPATVALNAQPTDRVRVTIRSVYSGTRWNDLCLTEVRVFEPASAATRTAEPDEVVVRRAPSGYEPATSDLDVGRPLLIIRPSATGVEPVREGFLGIDGSGHVVSMSGREPPTGLPECASGSTIPCVKDETTVRFRLGATCTGEEGAGMWWDSAMRQDPRCRSPVSICGAIGLSHDPSGDILSDDEGCPLGDVEERTLRNVGDACRGPSRGYTWQCNEDNTKLICTAPSAP